MKSVISSLLTALLLSVSDPALAVDDLPANKTTPVQIVVGTSAAGRLETAQDKDWIKLKLEAGQNVQLRRESYCSLSQPKLLDPTGRVIRNIPEYVEYPNGTEYVAPKAGVYFISFGPYAGIDWICSEEPGSPFPAGWGIKAAANCAEDARTNCALAPTGKLIRGQIDYQTEKDWFKVDITKAGSYTFELQCGANGNGGWDPVPLAECRSEYMNFSLRRSNSSVIADYKKTFTTFLGRGRYYLAVRDVDAIYGERLFSLRLRPAAP